MSASSWKVPWSIFDIRIQSSYRACRSVLFATPVISFRIQITSNGQLPFPPFLTPQPHLKKTFSGSIFPHQLPLFPFPFCISFISTMSPQRPVLRQRWTVHSTSNYAELARKYSKQHHPRPICKPTETKHRFTLPEWERFVYWQTPGMPADRLLQIHQFLWEK